MKNGIDITALTLSSKIDVDVSREDLINMMTVAYEKELRDEKVVLQGTLKAMREKQTKDSLKVDANLKEYVKGKMMVPVKALGEIIDSIDKFIGLKSGKNRKVFKANPYDIGAVDSAIEENGNLVIAKEFEVTMTNCGSVNFPWDDGNVRNRYGNKQSTSKFYLLTPAFKKEFIKSQGKVHAEMTEVTVGIAEIDTKLRDIGFNAKLVRAKITEQILSSTENGKKLLEGVKNG